MGQTGSLNVNRYAWLYCALPFKMRLNCLRRSREHMVAIYLIVLSFSPIGVSSSTEHQLIASGRPTNSISLCHAQRMSTMTVPINLELTRYIKVMSGFGTNPPCWIWPIRQR